MNNKSNFLGMVAALILAVMTFSGFIDYDTANSTLDKVVIALLWFGVCLSYMDKYFKGD